MPTMEKPWKNKATPMGMTAISDIQWEVWGWKDLIIDNTENHPHHIIVTLDFIALKFNGLLPLKKKKRFDGLLII